jgi:hypothetical protein
MRPVSLTGPHIMGDDRRIHANGAQLGASKSEAQPQQSRQENASHCPRWDLRIAQRAAARAATPAKPIEGSTCSVK